MTALQTITFTSEAFAKAYESQRSDGASPDAKQALASMTMNSKPRQLPAAQLKAPCLTGLDASQRTGRSIVVTKRGRPVGRVVPLASAPSRSLQGSVLDESNLLSPIDVEWDARS